jgi:hypothetical protein
MKSVCSSNRRLSEVLPALVIAMSCAAAAPPAVAADKAVRDGQGSASATKGQPGSPCAPKRESKSGASGNPCAPSRRSAKESPCAPSKVRSSQGSESPCAPKR